MRHIEYWEAKDGSRFENKLICMEHEIRLIEKENGILYYDYHGNQTSDFDYAWTVVLPRELSDEEYNELKDWYAWTVPNAEGKYTWNEDTEDWRN